MTANHTPVRGLIFDLDGTLVDNRALVYDAFRAGFLAIGHPRYTDDELLAMFGPTQEEIYQQRAGDRWEEGYQAYLAYYRRHATRDSLCIPGLAETLEWACNQGLLLGVVTGGSETGARLNLDLTGLTAYFKDISMNGIPSAPKHQRIVVMATGWALPFNQVAFIGDTPADMDHAKRAGAMPVGAAWAKASRPADLQAAGAVAVFTRPSDLRAWLAERVPV